MDNDVKQHNFTIYLFNEKFVQPTQAIVKPAKEYVIAHGKDHIGMLYVERKAPNPPRWADLFEGYVSRDELGLVASSSAALVVKASDRIFAITFGHGRYLLAQDGIEDRFGLKVVLNSIPPERLKSIDKKSFDAIDSNSRIQASQEAEAQDFGIDAEQDLLRAVTGVPSDSDLGSRLSGRDALHAITRIGIPDITAMLSRYYEKYLEDTYKAHFPRVDNIREISNNASLDELLIDILNDMRTSASTAPCWLAVPEIVDWERIDGFRYSTRQTAPIHHDLHLPGLFRSLPSSNLLTFDDLKHKSAYAIDGDGQILNKWPIYKCIHCEIETDTSIYVLSAGKWYEIAKDLAKLVNTFYESLPRYEAPLPQYDDTRESAYCERIAAESKGKLLLMDQNFIRITGRTNDIEFCDIYSEDLELLHIKRYGASSVLNHLFAQGLMSGECLKSLEGFAEELNKKLPKKFRVEERHIPRDVSRFSVVFAIISESEKPLEIPFFARVTLRQVAKRLQSVGFKVCLAKIPVSVNLSRVERIPSRR